MAVEPLMEVSGARSSWLTMLRNSAPHPIHLLQWRQVLHSDDHRLHHAVLGADRCRIDQRRDATPVGGGQHDLLDAHRLSAGQFSGQRELVECDLAPVGAPAGDLVEQLRRGAAGQVQAAPLSASLHG